MTNAEMLNLIMGRFGGRSSTTLRATALKELNEKIRQLEQADICPWFMKDVWTPNTQANVESLDLPSDYIRDDDDAEPEIRDPNKGWVEIHKVPYNRLRQETANALAQLPRGFSTYGEKIYFGPLPDAAYNFRLPYFKRTGSVVDNSSEISNKWLVNFFNLITLETVNIVAKLHIRDQQVVASVASELDIARLQFKRAVEAREHAGQEYLLTNEEN
jgi:hypothetical protein